jgi:large repetitive protein
MIPEAKDLRTKGRKVRGGEMKRLERRRLNDRRLPAVPGAGRMLLSGSTVSPGEASHACARHKPTQPSSNNFSTSHPVKTKNEGIVPLALALAALALNLSAIHEAKAAAWVTNGPMTTARAQHTATLLPGGKVLIAGGVGGPASSELYDPATGTCMATGTMNTNREGHTAVLLLNGKVLVAGGYYNGYTHSSAELYDPANGAWLNAGTMNTAREFHTATLLTNGTVLVVGGNLNVRSAELYDSGTGAWTMTGALTMPRQSHTATLLPSGKVLVTGGYGIYNPLTGYDVTNSAELYDPTTGAWTKTGSMIGAHANHTATLLPNGQVLVAGGHDQVGSATVDLSSAELYDPTSGTWTVTGTMNLPHNAHSATLLPNGKVLVAAGYNLAELYDPATETWAITAGSNSSRDFHTATLLPNGNVLVAGGFYGPSLSSTEVYDCANGTWTNTSTLNTARCSHTATLLPNGQVLVAGGSIGGSHSGIIRTNAELYDPTAGTWTNTGSLNTGRYEHTATLLPNGKVLVAAGIASCTNCGLGGVVSTSSAELYDPVTGIWTATGPLTVGRDSHTATLLPDGKVLVAGGLGGGASAELYDPGIGTWIATGAMHAGRYGHAAILLPTGKILVAGGGLSSTELYDPATGKWTPSGPMIIARSQNTETLLPNGKVLVVGGVGNGSTISLSSAELYDPAIGTWTLTGSIHTARQAHTATLLLNGKVIIAGGVSCINGPGGPAFGFPSTAELYDPAAGTWAVAGAMNTARDSHTATLVPNGKVIVTGGENLNGGVSNGELYDVGLGFNASWQPEIATVTSPLSLGSSLVITGSQFRGISGGSSGNTQDSPADYPVVQLRSIESGQAMFLLSTNWQTNSFTSLPVWNFPPGYALATVFVNGIPSTGSVLNISVPVPTATTLNGVQTLTNGSFQFAFTNNPGALFGVLATTNVSLPLSNWPVLGGVTEIAPGQFQFTDPLATNGGQRFYCIRTP